MSEEKKIELNTNKEEKLSFKKELQEINQKKEKLIALYQQKDQELQEIELEIQKVLGEIRFIKRMLEKQKDNLDGKISE